MANPDGVNATPSERVLLIRQLLPDFTRPDGSHNIRGLAAAAGVSRPTLVRIRDLIKLEDAKAAQENYTPDIDDILEAKPRVRVRAYNASVIRDLPVRRVVFIGDTHVKPGMDLEHFTWMGRYVAESRPDNVVQIGDFSDFESCEMHSAPGSASQRARPSFHDDVEATVDALDLYHREIGLGEIPHDITYGNHEYRVERYEEMAPTLAGTMAVLRDQAFARYRWKTTPYRHWLFMEGVGMTHTPISIMGKPIGGRYPENTIGNQSTHSCVSGHTHRWNHVTVPKIGINNAITVTNVGSAMPHGYTPKYCEGATTGYSYGIVDAMLRGGKTESANFISMLDLERRFS